MKTNSEFQAGSRTAWSPTGPIVRKLTLSILLLTGLQATVLAQTPTILEPVFTKPTWWVGAAAGGNLNFYQGTTQQLNETLMVPAAFRRGNGIGLYLAPLVEYRKPDSKWGIMLQAGYDGRSGKFERVVTPCNCPADLSTKLAYITVEPSLRFTPFKSNFYLFGGPRLAFNISKSFTYSQKTNPDFVEQVPIADVKGDFSSVKSTLISMQIGAGYDIYLTDEKKQRQTIVSPFVSFQPYFGQSPRSVETWTLTTVRVGAAIKFGRGKLVPPAEVVPLIDTMVTFSVNSPKNIPVERRVRETFPLRNYVFFDIGTTTISDRYVLLTKDQVKDFKEDQLEVFKPKRLSGRSDREMVVYYNVLNIVGDRMGKKPSSQVRLTGASMQGPAVATEMAESIKKYLVDIFGIDGSRINTEGRVKPRIPSEQPGGTKELDLLREGDNRVSIWSDSPDLMMEFQSGPDAPLKPVEIVGIQEAPVDSYVSFRAEPAADIYSSWSMDIVDQQGVSQHYGPYTQNMISIPGKSILGKTPEGDYVVTMIGTTKAGDVVRKHSTVHMVLWTPPTDEEGVRYSVIFEFNQSKAIDIYQRYLTEIVAPKIPINGKVIIHGHTDTIGDEASNQVLSTARANEVHDILASALKSAGRTDVTFDVLGFGEDQTLSPFNNNFPEERFYNRTVLIDIIPQK